MPLWHFGARFGEVRRYLSPLRAYLAKLVSRVVAPVVVAIIASGCGGANETSMTGATDAATKVGTTTATSAEPGRHSTPVDTSAATNTSSATTTITSALADTSAADATITTTKSPGEPTTTSGTTSSESDSQTSPPSTPPALSDAGLAMLATAGNPIIRPECISPGPVSEAPRAEVRQTTQVIKFCVGQSISHGATISIRNDGELIATATLQGGSATWYPGAAGAGSYQVLFVESAPPAPMTTSTTVAQLPIPPQVATPANAGTLVGAVALTVTPPLDSTVVRIEGGRPVDRKIELEQARRGTSMTFELHSASPTVATTMIYFPPGTDEVEFSSSDIVERQRGPWLITADGAVGDTLCVAVVLNPELVMCSYVFAIVP